MAFLAIWVGTTSTVALLAAVVSVAASAVAGPRGRGLAWGAGTVLIIAGILGGFEAERQMKSLRDDWGGYWQQRAFAEIGDLLSDELDRRQVDGQVAVSALAELWDQDPEQVDGARVGQLRGRAGASALALYDPAGRLVAWDGTHRGAVPESVQRGERREAYRDLPLFGHLYLTEVAGDGSVAVAAYLLRASLPEGLGADIGDLAARFYEETGERIRITEEDPGVGEAGWDLELEDDRLLSVVLEEPAQEVRIAEFRDLWTGRVALLLLVAWILLAIGGGREASETIVSALAALAVAGWFPLQALVPSGRLFDPELFVLPGPLGLSLGRTLLVSLALFTVAGAVPARRPRVAPWLVACTAALGFPVVLLWLIAGLNAAPEGRLEFMAYQAVAAALLALLAGWGITNVPGGAGRRRVAAWALMLTGALTLAGGVFIYRDVAPPIGFAALWAAPAWAAAMAARAWRGWLRPVVGWGLAILVGGSAAIPFMWGATVSARLAAGTERLEQMAQPRDSVVERMLLTFGEVVDSLDAAGAEDVSILYEGWRRSGFAESGHPVWLQIELRDGTPGEGLRVGVDEEEPEPYQDALSAGRAAGGIRLEHLGRDDARYILTSVVSGDRVVVAVAPPFPESSGRSALGPLLQSSSEVAAGALTVIPLAEGTIPSPLVPERARGRDGWQAEMGLSFENGAGYHAHYAVDLPAVPLGLARASLLLFMNLVLFMVFWAGGSAYLLGPAREDVRLRGLVISFRARVTLALFGFFALANALLGTVAYRAVEQASRRSTQVIAERVVEDAAGWYRALGGQIERLATQVGAELLEYRDGELVEGSVEELVDLGLYEAWTPLEVHNRLEGREVVQEFTETTLGQWAYVTAYRRLSDGDVLAAQVPLQAGTTALQTTDLFELLGFVVLLGAALSLALAMIAGRALTRPIHALQVASESVGSGDLDLRLPEHRADEFGAVFRAFNRMVGRVRRARRQLVRTSRRTQLIMDEAAVGMIAVDPEGRVTLVNPRTEELLGTEVFVGRPLPGRGPLGAALTSWVADFLEGSSEQANFDFQGSDRRVRVRARRLGTFGTRRGAVVALDDVTDELRAERVLAWGEMARQVAHEVKNPLTPIKLSIQHVRRAWDDGSPDFGEILVKNADAMLIEIDRLAGIAQSFSRFGAPGEGAGHLTGIVLADVVGEVMALYGASASPVRFESHVEADLPLVVARATELKEVLVNLLENARMSGKPDTTVRVLAQRVDDESVSMSVVDDGVGIPAEVLPRIFEPQFSTRSTGAGLGLAIVQRVVQSWHGSVEVESRVDHGTSVTVLLRVWPPPEASSQAFEDPT